MAKRLEELDSLIEELRNQQNDIRIHNSYDLLVVSGLMHKLFDAGYRETGLKRTQVMILSFMLANGGKATPYELRNKVFRSDNAISKSLDTLDKLGLTKSTSSSTDRRIRRVALTEKGLKTVTKILPIRSALFAKAMNSLSREEGEQMQYVLQKLISYLESATSKKSKKNEKRLFF